MLVTLVLEIEVQPYKHEMWNRSERFLSMTSMLLGCRVCWLPNEPGSLVPRRAFSRGGQQLGSWDLAMFSPSSLWFP